MNLFGRALRVAVACGALAAVGACGSTVEIDTGGPGGSSASSSGGGGGGGSAGSGTGAAPTAACEDLPPYAGPLCGTPDMPCHLLADENMGDGFGQNDAPAVAVGPDCAPHVVFAALTIDYEGIYADRLGPGQWQEAVLPGPSALAGHVIGSDGTSYLLTYDGALQTTLRARPPGGTWQDLGLLPGTGWFESAALAIDDEDRLYAAWTDEGQHLRHAVRSGGAWSEVPVPGGGTAGSNQVAVTPGGAAHIAYWGQTPSGWEPMYWAVGSPPHPVVDPEEMPLDPPAQWLEMALSPDGEPVLLLARVADDPPSTSLSVARPAPGGGWSLMTLVKPQKDDDPCTGTVPANGNQTCKSVTGVVLVPLAVVVSRGGDTRFLYGRQSTETTYEAKCTPPPGPETICTWQVTASEPAGEVHIASLGAAGGVDDVQIAGGRPYAGNAVIDRRGVIHMAAYDAADTDHPTRYLQIGP